ncbi:WxL domain-containing protein [Pediococcus argentinicus]|uniref:WxL domain-containing protein n=1 Tax=Pediococcus argentinicus TaxID=480391 RepID=A0A0R2NCW6_9LACO|nr:WxL domain-containing protein [Pediococcus argentinicus]KRO23686.1 hypothetical protein IV88_GL000895 [Pediococcus argentinicus]NKZ22861.1 hypothetical protein [Pediococcus argentinicus]GEP19916.1 hypothetical protein LSA03_13000 [Pediococcus argentinicus]
MAPSKALLALVSIISILIPTSIQANSITTQGDFKINNENTTPLRLKSVPQLSFERVPLSSLHNRMQTEVVSNAVRPSLQGHNSHLTVKDERTATERSQSGWVVSAKLAELLHHKQKTEIVNARLNIKFDKISNPIQLSGMNTDIWKHAPKPNDPQTEYSLKVEAANMVIPKQNKSVGVGTYETKILWTLTNSIGF